MLLYTVGLNIFLIPRTPCLIFAWPPAVGGGNFPPPFPPRAHVCHTLLHLCPFNPFISSNYHNFYQINRIIHSHIFYLISHFTGVYIERICSKFVPFIDMFIFENISSRTKEWQMNIVCLRSLPNLIQAGITFHSSPQFWYRNFVSLFSPKSRSY